MSLPPSNPEAPLTPLVDKVVFFVNKQALPVGPSSSQLSPAKAHSLTGSVIKLGVGIGSAFNAFYGAPALAASFPEDLISTDTQPTSADLGIKRTHQAEATSATQSILPWEMTRSLNSSPDLRTALILQPAPTLSDMGELARMLTQPQPLTGNQQARLLAVQGNYSPKFSIQTASTRTKKASRPKAQPKFSSVESFTQSVTQTALIRSEEAANLLHPDSTHDLLDIATLAPELSTLAAIGGSLSSHSPSTSEQAQNPLSQITLEQAAPEQETLGHPLLTPDVVTADPIKESETSVEALEVEALEVEALEKEAFITVEDTSLKDASSSQETLLEETPLAESDASALQNAPLQNTLLKDGAEEDDSQEDCAEEDGAEDGAEEDCAVSHLTEPNIEFENTIDNTLAQAEGETSTDPLSQRLERLQREAQMEESGEPDDELGTLRIQQTRGRANEELGVLRLLQTAQAPPPKPKPPISFLTGRLGFFSSENAFRSNPRLNENINQAGLAYYLFPKLSDTTSLYAIAETNLARYGNFGTVDYNELEFQLGVRQRLFQRTFAQVGWRNQRLYSPGYREKLFSVHYIDTLISHRSILNSKTWVDGFYQARLGFADPESASRFRQTFTVSLNYGVSRDFRTSLLYQLDLDDYTQVARHDTYQQLLGVISYNLTPESRLSLFGGTRFGRSSSPGVNLDDTFYGAGLNVSVPLF